MRHCDPRSAGQTVKTGSSAVRRIGLVGCVKKKASQPLPAQDLYISTLFDGRRSFVERSCTEWWILSALHGLVRPDQTLAPYDTTLKKAGRAARQQWSESVVSALDAQVHLTPNDTFEIHAGAEYRDFGVVDGLKARGCSVVIPTQGMGIGKQLAFYKAANGSHP